jgi:hypothetical protein
MIKSPKKQNLAGASPARLQAWFPEPFFATLMMTTRLNTNIISANPEVKTFFFTRKYYVKSSSYSPYPQPISISRRSPPPIPLSSGRVYLPKNRPVKTRTFIVILFIN